MAQASLNDEKTGGQKSRWTVPLKKTGGQKSRWTVPLKKTGSEAHKMNTEPIHHWQ